MRIEGQRVSNDPRLMKDDSLKENGIWNRYESKPESFWEIDI
jgi:hypothetical protein